LDFELTPDQRELQESAIAFARSGLNHDVIAADAEERFSHTGWRLCADFGLQGMPIPEQYGGLGLALSSLLAVMEGLGYGTRDQGLLFSINAHLWTNSIPILRYGTEAQRNRYLPGLCRGDLIGANGASEPDAGSDIFAMRTRAERRGDHYVLNGTKMFVTNAPVANTIVAYATIDPALGAMGITAFIIDADTPGVTIGRKLEKMACERLRWPRSFSKTAKCPWPTVSVGKDEVSKSSSAPWNGSGAASSLIAWV
jgi:alkylation response protein AidB-like acyl-CoA dehydrogenase